MSEIVKVTYRKDEPPSDDALRRAALEAVGGYDARLKARQEETLDPRYGLAVVEVQEPQEDGGEGQFVYEVTVEWEGSAEYVIRANSQDEARDKAQELADLHDADCEVASSFVNRSDDPAVKRPLRVEAS